MIRIACRCGVRLKAADEDAGQTRSCPKCGAELVVPRPPGSAPAKAKAKDQPAPPEQLESPDDDRPRTRKRPAPRPVLWTPARKIEAGALAGVSLLCLFPVLLVVGRVLSDGMEDGLDALGNTWVMMVLTMLACVVPLVLIWAIVFVVRFFLARQRIQAE